MPTRFYIPSSGTPPVAAPALPTGWTAGTTADIEVESKETKQNTALTDFLVAETSASATNISVAIGITRGLSAQTISGTFTAVFRGLESATSADDSLQVGIYLLDSTGAVKATLYAGHAAALNATAGALGQEFGTAASTRIMPSTAFTSATAVAGDRLMFIVGYRSHDTVTTSRSSTIRVGDPSATSDFALTAGLTTDLVPWIELSGTITFPATQPVGDTWQTSWNVVGRVPDSWQTSWNVVGQIAKSWQTIWDTFIQWSAINTTTWASHSTETWGTIAPAVTLTPVGDTWQTSWNVLKSETDTWQTSWNILAQLSDSYQTSWNVIGRVSDSYQTSWNVLAQLTDTYQTSWNIIARVSDAWQTSWNVISRVSDSWQTSWNISAQLGDSWQTSWNVLAAISDNYQTSWNILAAISDSWQTSWNTTGVVSDSWQTSWNTTGPVSSSYTTYWNISAFFRYDRVPDISTVYLKEIAGSDVWTKANTGSTAYVPVGSPVVTYDEVDKPTTIWSKE